MQIPPKSLFTAEYLHRPPVFYKKLHEFGPVYFDVNHQFWVVTGFDLVTTILRHPDVSSDREGIGVRRFPKQEQDAARIKLQALGRSMILMDPPEHTRLRQMANPLMVRERVGNWQPEIERIFQEVLEPCLKKREFDLVHDVCERFPTRVIFYLFDVPESDREIYRQCVARSTRLFGYNLNEVSKKLVDDSTEAAIRSRGIIRTLLKARQAHPGEDLLSEMAASIESGEAGLEEMTRMASLIVSAGHVTTVDLLANGIYQLLSHSDQWELLKEKPDLVGSCVEEILRFDSSVPFMFRRALNDIPVPGGVIRKGDFMAIGLAAANHDPAVNDDPDVFDITRPKIRHISFGQGSHVCLGANLARLEMKVALSALVKAMPDLRFAEDPVPFMKTETLTFKGFHALPLVH